MLLSLNFPEPSARLPSSALTTYVAENQVEERMSAGFTAKHEKHPDWQKNMECASYMEAADMAMQRNRPAEAAKLMGTGAICFGTLFKSSKLTQAKECVKKHGDGAEPCMDVLSCAYRATNAFKVHVSAYMHFIL